MSELDGMPEYLESTIEQLHSAIQNASEIHRRLLTTKLPCARAAAIAVTNAETALLWLGHVQAMYRRG